MAEGCLINAHTDAKSAIEELSREYDLRPSESAMRATKAVYAPLQKIIPEPEWAGFAPYIVAIQELKKERDAVLLAHNYMTPEIYHTVADFVGDSLQLAIEASKVDNSVIVQCGVYFMAETAKILNPDKTVLIPDSRAGCSLASSITAQDVEELRTRNPGVPVVSYVNSSASVKAVSDICCTSANASQIVEALEESKVIMVPDGYLARNVARTSSKKIIWWEGVCEVHARFSSEEIQSYREQHPHIKVLAHPECPPEVMQEADFAGSTSAMIGWVKREKPQKALLLTECSMSDNIAAELPEVEFVRPCNICPHMKRITLENILWSLHTRTEEVFLDEQIAEPARRSLEYMIELSDSGSSSRYTASYARAI